jgi:2-hydroxymuconate-semialdehyde hydrolase
MTVTNATVQTGSFQTYYNRSGEDQRETILFLHGSGPGVTAWSNWQLALPCLDDQFHCLAIDLAGFGETDHPSDPPSLMRGWMRLWVDQCMAFMDAMRIEKAHLVGNSMGGAIALNLLMEASDRFDRAVLMGSIGTPHPSTPEIDRLWGFFEDPSERVLSNIFHWFVYDETFIADRLDAIAKARYEAAMKPEVRRSFEAMFPAPRSKVIEELIIPELALRRVNHPVLLVHGRDDHIVPLDTSLHLLKHLPDVQLHVFGQCSHWSQIEKAKGFNELLARFFGGYL